MKKTAFLLIKATVAIITFSNSVNAQKNDIAFNARTQFNRFLSPFEKMGFGEIRVNDINIKAVRDFVKTFKNVDNNKWLTAGDDGFTSTFNSDGIKTIVAYDNTGYREYVMRVYDENKLPFDIRDRVKREYYDNDITLVKETETDKGVVTYVHMQDKDTWKIVRIADGEMQLVQVLNK